MEPFRHDQTANAGDAGSEKEAWLGKRQLIFSVVVDGFFVAVLNNNNNIKRHIACRFRNCQIAFCNRLRIIVRVSNANCTITDADIVGLCARIASERSQTREKWFF